MNTTIDTISFDDAEDFKLPSDGNHNGNLSSVEFAATKAGDREQFIVTVTLSPEDPDSPNLPMRFYVGWPHPDDKDILWGTRTAYGSKVKSLKDLMTCFGGKESGAMSKEDIMAFLSQKVGTACKVRVKQSKRQDTDELQANVQGLYPA